MLGKGVIKRRLNITQHIVYAYPANINKHSSGSMLVGWLGSQRDSAHNVNYNLMFIQLECLPLRKFGNRAISHPLTYINPQLSG